MSNQSRRRQRIHQVSHEINELIAELNTLILEDSESEEYPNIAAVVATPVRSTNQRSRDTRHRREPVIVATPVSRPSSSTTAAVEEVFSTPRTSEQPCYSRNTQRRYRTDRSLRNNRRSDSSSSSEDTF